MADNEIQVPQQITQPTDLSKKIWKFLLEIALSNATCEHVEKAKQLLKDISVNL